MTPSEPTSLTLTPEGKADTGAFLARLVRLDPTALVRLRPAGPARPGYVGLWARLPFDVLATRLVASSLTEDATVRAAELLRSLERGAVSLPQRHDLAWRAPLPPHTSEVLERVSAEDLRRISQAAADTMRLASGRGVGERKLRDELLDHVALVVTAGGGASGDACQTAEQFEIPVRLVQGVVRMGFLGADDSRGALVRRAAGWLGLDAAYGAIWRRPASVLQISRSAR